MKGLVIINDIELLVLVDQGSWAVLRSRVLL
jgi:hypothetical protein